MFNIWEKIVFGCFAGYMIYVIILMIANTICDCI